MCEVFRLKKPTAASINSPPPPPGRTDLPLPHASALCPQTACVHHEHRPTVGAGGLPGSLPFNQPSTKPLVLRGRKGPGGRDGGGGGGVQAEGRQSSPAAQTETVFYGKGGAPGHLSPTLKFFSKNKTLALQLYNNNNPCITKNLLHFDLKKTVICPNFAT